jgi:glycosyltransferase involved in cell wall biosynthesis
MSTRFAGSLMPERPAEAPARNVAVLLQSLDGGGSQRRVVDLVNGFVAHGRHVDLLLVRPGGPLRERLAPSVRIIELDRKKPEADLADYLDREKPDALLAGASTIHPIAVEATRLSAHRTPLILRASIHPYRYFPWALPRQRLLEQVRRRLRVRRFGAADLIITVSDDIARTLRAALPGATITTITNPTITQSFLERADAALDWPWDGDGGAPTIIGVGRFAVAKDFPTLLRAFALVRKQRDVRLIILGSGSERERQTLATLASRLGISNDVAFPGQSNEVAAWLRRADLFVSPSLWEGAQGALIEALAMGVPVVATDCIGSALDLLADERLGRLVPPRKPRLMAEAILEELHTRRDPAMLKAAVAAYGSGDRAAEYLEAIDACVARFGAAGPRRG